MMVVPEERSVQRPTLEDAGLVKNAMRWFVAWAMVACFAHWGVGQGNDESIRVEGTESKSFGWPHVRTLDQFVFHGTFPIDAMEEQFERLRMLRSEISKTLNLQLPSDTIHIAIFKDRAEFDLYVRRYFPSAPNRRALFIRDRGNALVLTYLHDQWLVDARHECSHALVHAAIQSKPGATAVPLWLDEGLAECFESESAERENHRTHGPAVRTRLRYGQVCEIETLESIDSSKQLSPTDYRDAWSAVNLLLHESAASRLALQEYLADILAGRASGLISHRIHVAIPDWRDAYTAYYQRPMEVREPRNNGLSLNSLHP